MPVSCRVCFEPFSATSHPPRLLGCGHSFCSSCTDSLYAVSAYMVFCPVCRSRLSSRVVPPINYQLLELIAAAEEESSPPTITMSPGATAVQDVVLERHEETKLDESTANGKPTVVETSEVVESCGCPVNLKAVKDAVNDLPEEYKEAARTSSLVFVSLMGLFFSIVLYRYLRHLYMPEPEGFFCHTFAWLFAPLFDALCEVQPPGGFFHEMFHESSVLAGELQDAFSHFISSIFDGFHAMGMIFSKMIEGIFGNLDYGIHELLENVRENLAFLIRFCGQVVHAILHAFASSIAAFADSISNTFHSMTQNTEQSSGFFS
ncbi:hypothetical protein Y032_0025g1181 [Ancylostoma ceylanicum]|uniref:RING-type domain-containing protein n=1 Tax=Ancylostoma ceylanicum TaxID=53326 RepID=A0A016UXC4_9BILA|nr:hypothetical protein Y032_0025g1181 [Ancylostoma ceylanicum]